MNDDDAGGTLRRAGDISLWTRSQGQGEPLLLISGLGYSSWCWYELAPALAHTRRVITFDNRGTGLSDKAAGPYSIAMLADDAARVLDAHGIAQADVIGHSMGGYIAQALALNHAQRVRRLVLVGTSAGGVDSVPLPEATRAAWEASAKLPPEQSVRMNMPASFSPGWTDAHPQRFEEFLRRRLVNPTPPLCWQQQYNACVDFFVQGSPVERIAHDTLVIHGTEDRVVPYANGEILSRRLPHARLETFDGVGHIPYLEQPQRFVDALHTHLDF
ncbi:MAG TPA: alpha/beta fold hydrolase [Nevskiaceae bacterium]|nr:alpha/beta fold hydrolase [Nevskiaceae bacterium]